MARNEEIREALQALVAGAASDADRELIREAMASEGLQRLTGERAVAVGGNANGSTFVTGDKNVVVSFPAADAAAIDRAIDRLFPSRLHQLPADLADFTGREREVAELEALLSGDGAAAAITAIGGMGGIGKSALAIHVAHRLIARYPDGQLVIDMGGTTDQPLTPAAAMERVIHSFEPGARLPDEADAVAALYRSLLAGKRALIILDNALDGAQVRPLMPPPPCAAMVTSRRGMALDGVRSFNLDALSGSEAEGLLGGILGPDRVSDAEMAELAVACGRLPLALRVAGAFLNLHRDWTAAEYLAAVADQRERLTRLRIEGDEMLDVLASLGLSVAQLAREQADLAARWRMLGVFARDFERAAAAAVWEVTSTEARDGLSALVERSMVLFDEDAMRYRLHDLMGDVARGADLEGADLAALAPIEQQAAARHAEHYLAVLGSTDDLYLRGNDGITEGLALFDLEWRNIEAGQAWAARTAPEDETAARACGDYPLAGVYVLDLRLHARAQIVWLEASVGAARRLRDRAIEGNALGILGLAYAVLGETRRAIEFHEQYLEIAREIGNRRGEGNALGNLGSAYFTLGETRRAIEFYERALKIFRDIGDRWAEGQNLGNLGNAYAALGETRRAIEFYGQDLEIAREIGDRRGEGDALIGLGNTYAALGETRRVIEFYEQQLEITREIGDRRGEAIGLYNLGNELAKAGKRGQAITRLQETLKIYEEIESPHADEARAALARLESDD